MKLTKYHYQYIIIHIISLCFDDKRFIIDDGIHALAYFHEDSVTSCKEIKKDRYKEVRNN